MAGRDTPKDVQDGPYGEQPDAVSNFSVDPSPIKEMSEADARRLALECYQASTNWLNAGRRAKWNDSLRAFQGLHPSGSKYLSSEYRYRSRHFRPKTRAMVRRAEAQTAAAFFSNQEIVSIEAQDGNDPKQVASAELLEQLLQYRLTKTIPWFQTVVGARQDAEVMGICISKQYWIYEEGQASIEDHILQQQPKPKVDKPWIDLIPPENFRFDPGCDWRNPVESSPYLIEIIPMYINDAKEKMASGEWFDVGNKIKSSNNLDDDITRRSREQGRVPGKDKDSWKAQDYDIVWVNENVIKWHGEDWHFYSLPSGDLLTLPKPLKEVYLHGLRPWVIGQVVVEAHKTYPSAKAELVRDLQMMTNDTTNLRFDNVKLALNPRQFIASGKGIEVQDVRSMQPGKVVLMKDPRNDVVWDRPPEVTQSAYAEQDRINLDFDELVGSFSPSTLASGSNPVVPETVGGMEHMAAPSVSMNEYELRVFAETWVEKVLYQMVKLEQAYETDAVVLALAGNKAQLFQRYGVNQITDDLLNQELSVTCNVGVGTTNPSTKLQHFLTAGQSLTQMFGPSLMQATHFSEVAKEIFGLLGYKDGSRFIDFNFDPAKAAQAQQQNNPHAAQMQIAQQKMQMDQAKLQAGQSQDQARMQMDQQDLDRKHQLELAKFQAEQAMEQQRMQMELMRIKGELDLQQQQAQAQMNIEHMKMQNAHQVNLAKAQQAPTVESSQNG